MLSELKLEILRSYRIIFNLNKKKHRNASIVKLQYVPKISCTFFKTKSQQNQNKTATKSKQKRNKIMIVFDQNFDFVAVLLCFCCVFVLILLRFCCDFVVVLF